MLMIFLILEYMYKYYVDIIYNNTYIDIYRYSYRYRYMGALDCLHDVTIYIYIYKLYMPFIWTCKLKYIIKIKMMK